MTREEAIKILKRTREDTGDLLYKALDMAIKALEEPQWIPCSSGQMPDDLAEVNITWVNRDPEPYYAFIKDKPFTGSAVHYKGKWYWYSAVCTDYLGEYGTSPNDIMDDAIKVIAWMPLPEPWRGDAE